jgi:hypothetical protein
MPERTLRVELLWLIGITVGAVLLWNLYWTMR